MEHLLWITRTYEATSVGTVNNCFLLVDSILYYDYILNGVCVCVCEIRKKQILYYTYLTKDKDVKQQGAMLIKDMTHMSTTLAICSIFTLQHVNHL